MEYTILGSLDIRTNYQARDIDVLTINAIFAKLKAYVETINTNVSNVKDGISDVVVYIGTEPPSNTSTLWIDTSD